MRNRHKQESKTTPEIETVFWPTTKCLTRLGGVCYNAPTVSRIEERVWLDRLCAEVFASTVPSVRLLPSCSESVTVLHRRPCASET